MSCMPCARDLHSECVMPTEEGDCCCSLHPAAIALVESVKRGRPLKADDEITISAGRKRLAELYPNIEGRICEWRWKADCGGGKHPILGCISGMQEHRHHGPVKNTSRNEPTNTHLICTPCHNAWHGANDGDYDEVANELLPHKPRPMTAEELLMRTR